MKIWVWSLEMKESRNEIEERMRSKKKEEKDVFATKLCSSSSSWWFNFHQRKGWLSFYVFFFKEKNY